ncbi:hypothetical protein LINGRAHAP2_LOCUS1892, partial [Linum grandiflorum]
VLIMIHGLLEIENSLFQRMECIEFHTCDDLIASRRVFNALISYFFDDCIPGKTNVFDHIFAGGGGGDDGDEGDERSRPVVVYRSDLPS